MGQELYGSLSPSRGSLPPDPSRGSAARTGFVIAVLSGRLATGSTVWPSPHGFAAQAQETVGNCA